MNKIFPKKFLLRQVLGCALYSSSGTLYSASCTLYWTSSIFLKIKSPSLTGLHSTVAPLSESRFLCPLALDVGRAEISCEEDQENPYLKDSTILAKNFKTGENYEKEFPKITELLWRRCEYCGERWPEWIRLFNGTKSRPVNPTKCQLATSTNSYHLNYYLHCSTKSR